MRCKCQCECVTYVLIRDDTLALRSIVVADGSGVGASELLVVDETVGNVEVVAGDVTVHGHGVAILEHEVVVHGHEAVGRELVGGREGVRELVVLLGRFLRLVGRLFIVDRLLNPATQGVMVSLVDLRKAFVSRRFHLMLCCLWKGDEGDTHALARKLRETHASMTEIVVEIERIVLERHPVRVEGSLLDTAEERVGVETSAVDQLVDVLTRNALGHGEK